MASTEVAASASTCRYAERMFMSACRAVVVLMVVAVCVVVRMIVVPRSHQAQRRLTARPTTAIAMASP